MTSLKQNMIYVRNLSALIDEQVYTSAVSLSDKGDTVIIQLKLTHRDHDVQAVKEFSRRMTRALARWQRKTSPSVDENPPT